MKKYLKMNKKCIIREVDKMIFSAKDMKIFKFNNKGFDVANAIFEADGIEEEELFDRLKETYSKEEFERIINKMLDNRIIVIEEE